MKTKLFVLVLVLAFALAACAGTTLPPLPPPPYGTVAAPFPTAGTLEPAVPTAAAPSPVAGTAPITATLTTAGIPEFSRYGPEGSAVPETAPGRYKTPAYFSLPFTFETHKPFRGFGEQYPKGEVFGLYQGLPVIDCKAAEPGFLGFWAIDPRFSAEQAATMLRETPGVDIRPNQPVQVAGINGTQIDMARSGTEPADFAIPAIKQFEGFTGTWVGCAGASVRNIVLEVNGRAFLIYVEVTKENFDSFMTDVNQILGTVKFVAD